MLKQLCLFALVAFSLSTLSAESMVGCHPKKSKVEVVSETLVPGALICNCTENKCTREKEAVVTPVVPAKEEQEKTLANCPACQRKPAQRPMPQQTLAACPCQKKPPQPKPFEPALAACPCQKPMQPKPYEPALAACPCQKQKPMNQQAIACSKCSDKKMVA